MADQAFIDLTHSDPRTGRVSQVVWTIRHGSNETDVGIRLSPHVEPEGLAEVDWPSQFRAVAAALYRIADSPSAIVPPRPDPT